jgi:hypothetical protein
MVVGGIDLEVLKRDLKYLSTEVSLGRTKMGEAERNIVRLEEKISGLTEALSSLDRALHGRYVSQVEFLPIKRLVYGGVGMVLTGVLAAVLGLIIVR